MCLRTPDIYLLQSQTDHSALNNASGAIVEGRSEKTKLDFKGEFSPGPLRLRAKSSRETIRRSPL